MRCVVNEEPNKTHFRFFSSIILSNRGLVFVRMLKWFCVCAYCASRHCYLPVMMTRYLLSAPTLNRFFFCWCCCFSLLLYSLCASLFSVCISILHRVSFVSELVFDVRCRRNRETLTYLPGRWGQRQQYRSTLDSTQ